MKSKGSKKTEDIGEKTGDTGESVKKKPAHEKPISLKPLEFEEAVKGLFKVRPEDDVKRPTKR